MRAEYVYKLLICSRDWQRQEKYANLEDVNLEDAAAAASLLESESSENKAEKAAADQKMENLAGKEQEASSDKKPKSRKKKPRRAGKKKRGAEEGREEIIVVKRRGNVLVYPDGVGVDEGEESANQEEEEGEMSEGAEQFESETTIATEKKSPKGQDHKLKPPSVIFDEVCAPGVCKPLMPTCQGEDDDK